MRGRHPNDGRASCASPRRDGARSESRDTAVRSIGDAVMSVQSRFNRAERASIAPASAFGAEERSMRTETLTVGGMTCGGCVSTVTEALKAVGGVRDVAVSLDAGEARIEFDERTTSPDDLRAAVRRAGYQVDVVAGKSHTSGGCCG